MFKGNRIRIRGILLGEMVQQEMGSTNKLESKQGQYAVDASPREWCSIDDEELLFLAGEQGNTFDADVDNQPVQDLALNEDNIFQADECDAFDSDVDDEPTAQSIFMANLSSVGSANPQAGLSNASILSKVHILENAIDHSIQKSLVTEVRAMKAVFENLEAEVDQNETDLRSENSKCVTIPDCKPKVLAPGRYPIDVEPIPPRLKKNQEVHLHYIERLKENVETLPIAPVAYKILRALTTRCSKHMTGDRSRLRNFVKKFIGTVRFGNDHFGAIMGYGDYVIGDSVISRVYYVEGLGHNLFSVGQFCDSDLEVAFRKHTCFVRDLDGVDLIKGSCGTNLYTISVEDMMRSSPIFLLSKASKNKSWLWHRRLNHLNFGTLNDLARKDLVRGLPRLKFEKDHLCSACQLGKSRKATHKPKTINTIMEVLHTLHMDLCGPLRVQSINVNKYILHWHYSREDSPITPQRNGFVETKESPLLLEAARTMLIFSKAPLAVPNSAPATPYVPPTNKDLELLLQPMFDEYFETPTGDNQMPHIPAVPLPVILTGLSVSISFDNDEPSGSHSSSSSAYQSSLVHHGVATEHSFEVNSFAATEHEPFVNVFAPDTKL
ncbi:retrovirus-related pol polyprotein from transposon TNT 1-94 [Tanacetum coccineum]